jgi:hypothetical protein
MTGELIKPLHPPLEMNSQILQQGTNHKHLGLFFSNNGLWHDHIDYIAKKAYTRLNMFSLPTTDGWCYRFLLSLSMNYVPETLFIMHLCDFED